MGTTNAGMRRYQHLKRELHRRGLSTAGKRAALEARLASSTKKAPKKKTKAGGGRPAGHKPGCGCFVCARGTTRSKSRSKSKSPRSKSKSPSPASSHDSIFPWGW